MPPYGNQHTSVPLPQMEMFWSRTASTPLAWCCQVEHKQFRYHHHSRRDFLASWISCISLECPVHICNSSQPGLSARGSLKSQGWQLLLAEILPFSSNTNTALCTVYLPGNSEGMKAISYLTAHFSVGGQCVLMCNSLCSPQEWGSWKSPKMRLWPEEFAL